jgi:hypothetical protein
MQQPLFGNAALQLSKFRDGMMSLWRSKSAEGERLVS